MIEYADDDKDEAIVKHVKPYPNTCTSCEHIDLKIDQMTKYHERIISTATYALVAVSAFFVGLSLASLIALLSK